MSPNVVCQQSFFTLPVRSAPLTQFVLALAHLPLPPALHQLLPHPLNLLDQTLLGFVGQLQIARAVLRYVQHLL